MENIKNNLLFFGTDNKNSFDSYHLIDKKSDNFKNILIYNISKKVKKIDEKAKKALYALDTILNRTVSTQKEREAYENLDTFLITTPAFRRYIYSLNKLERETLKRTVISSMIEKIYDNITKDRGVSNLRFALVLLKNRLNKLDDNLKSHIFYDIQNGVNINREIERNFINRIKDSINQKELAQKIEPNNNSIEFIIKKDDENRFINSFLRTLLSMHSLPKYDRKKISILVGYICYILSVEDIKITKKNGIEKIQIAHSFMLFIEYQINYNSMNFVLMLEEFLNKNNYENIELFFRKRVSIKKYDLEIKEGTLRQKNLKFLNNLLIIGDFFKLISAEQDIDSIISSFQQKVLTKDIDVAKYSKEPIISKFLKLFAKEYRKKEYQDRLKEFLKTWSLIHQREIMGKELIA